MDEDKRVEVQGEVWAEYDLAPGVKLRACDNGVRLILDTPKGPATWDLADAPVADKFLPVPA